MRKNGKKIMAAVLVPFAVINIYAGYKWMKNSNLKDTKIEPKSITVEDIERNDSRIIIDDSVFETDSSGIEVEEASKESVFSTLQAIYEAANKSVDEIIKSEDKMSELYASGLYVKLKNAGLSDEVIRTEIDHILMMSLTFTDMDEVTWGKLFGNLDATIGEEENVMDYYYPLAIYVHKSECELEHTSSDIDKTRVTCARLEEMANSVFTDSSYSEYVKEMIEVSGSQNIISQYNRLVGSGLNLEDVLGELDTIYILSQTPMCIDEELWNTLFRNLLTTVDEYENIFEVYGELASFIHALNCDYNHSVDEYGINVCEGMRLYK